MCGTAVVNDYFWYWHMFLDRLAIAKLEELTLGFIYLFLSFEQLFPSACNLMSFPLCASVMKQLVCVGVVCEASLFCEAPRWLAKQTTDVRLRSLRAQSLRGNCRNLCYSSPLSLRSSVYVIIRFCSWPMRAQRMKNVYIQYVSAANRCCYG